MKFNKIIKYTLAIALVFGTVATMSACGKNDTQTEESEQEKIYRLAVEAGYEGTYAEWLESIKGEDGKDGKNGATWLTGTIAPTATQGVNGDFYFDSVAQKIYNKVSDAWQVIATIEDGVPGVGINGKEVEFDVNNTYIRWRYKGDSTWINLVALDSLKGEAGANGSTWLEGEGAPLSSLGKDDDFYLDSISKKIYNKKNGTWSVVTTIEDGKGISVIEKTSENGLNVIYTITYTDGSTSTFTIVNGEDGKGISNVEVSYDIDNEGNEYTVFKFTYTDGSFEEVRVAMPKKISYISYNGPSYINVRELGNEPNLKLYVQYEDDSYEEVNLTQDMFVVDEFQGYEALNVYRVGEYNVKIKYKGKTFTTTISVVDPDDDSIKRINVSDSNIVMLVGSSGIIQDYTGLNLDIQLANGNENSIPLSDSSVSVDVSSYESIGTPFIATVTYQEFTTSFNVMPIENIADYDIIQAQYYGNGQFNIELNQNVFNNNEYIEFTLEIDENTYSYMMKTTDDLLLNFNNAEVGSNRYRFDSTKLYNYSLDNEISITVYDSTTAVIENVYGEAMFKVGVGNYGDVNLAVELNLGNDNYVTKKVALDESMITDGVVSFDKAGNYLLTINYEGVVGRVYVEIYDPTTCNISYISANLDEVNAYLNSSIDTYIAQHVVGKTARIYFYEEVDGKRYEDIVLTTEMVDTSKLDFTKLGTQNIFIKYALPGQQEYSAAYFLNVIADMSNANLVKTYQPGEYIASMFGYASIAIYDNGVGVFSITTEPDLTNGIMVNYTIENNLFKYIDTTLGGDVYYQVDGDVINMYVPSGRIAKTYQTTINMFGQNAKANINIYDDSSVYIGDGEYYATVTIVDYNNAHYATVKANINKENNTITIFDENFSIDLEDNLTKIQ